MKQQRSYEKLLEENEELRWQLEEANDTITAIRTGQVDALVVQGAGGSELYTLKTADQAYRVFIEKMNEGAITLNDDGTVLYCNSSFAAMVGEPMSNVTGRKLTAFILPEYSPALEMLLIKAKSEDIKLELALLNQTSGMQLPCQVSMTRLPIDKEMAFSVIITDLTFHKLTEGVLKQKNDELAKTVAELESSNHDLQQFASVASHDLQEPLRKIILFSGMLRDKLRAACSETGIEFLEKIIASSRRMRTLITDILQYSRLSQDDNHLVSTNLGDLVREVLQDFDLLIQEKGAAVTLGALPEAEVNPGQMRQVFQNLISNALKFSRPGVRPEIAIQCLPADDEHPGAPCTILIKDNGIGFSQQYADRIFSLFQRLNTKDTFEGSGIGLAITKKIMDKHKGAIEAQSEEGRGSAFVLRLPLRQ